MRSLLNALCAVTAAACTWLGVMFLVLHRPGFEQGAVLSALFVVECGVSAACVNGWATHRAWRIAALLGGVLAATAGTALIVSNLNKSHFEGYLLIIGALLILQGTTTLLT